MLGSGVGRVFAFTLPLQFSFIILCVFSLLGLFFFFDGHKGEESERSNDSYFLYNYLEKNSVNNESAVGFISLSERIGERDYVYIQEALGIHVLISNFGSNQFECSGKCFCEEGDRRISGALKTGMKYLLVAVSTTVAMKLAKEYFEDECYTKFSDTCSISSIRTEVDECESISTSNDRSRVEENQFAEYRKYECYGSCLPSGRIRHEKPLSKLCSYHCDDLKREGEVVVSEKDLLIHSGEYSSRFAITARVKFTNEYLKTFCPEHSRYSYDADYKIEQFLKDEKVKLYDVHQHHDVSLCRGSKKASLNPTVKCLQVDPPSRSNNRKKMKKVWLENRIKWKQNNT